jgi:hypothetical protein
MRFSLRYDQRFIGGSPQPRAWRSTQRDFYGAEIKQTVRKLVTREETVDQDVDFLVGSNCGRSQAPRRGIPYCAIAESSADWRHHPIEVVPNKRYFRHKIVRSICRKRRRQFIRRGCTPVDIPRRQTGPLHSPAGSSTQALSCLTRRRGR